MAKKAKEEINKAQEEKEMLEKELAYLSQKVGETRKQNLDFELENNKIAEEIAATQTSYDSLKSDIEVLESERESLRNNVKKLKQEKGELQDICAKLSNERDSLSKETKKMIQDKGNIALELEKLQASKDSVESDLKKREGLVQLNLDVIRQSREELERREALVLKRENLLNFERKVNA